MVILLYHLWSESPTVQANNRIYSWLYPWWATCLYQFCLPRGVTNFSWRALSQWVTWPGSVSGSASREPNLRQRTFGILILFLFITSNNFYSSQWLYKVGCIIPILWTGMLRLAHWARVSKEGDRFQTEETWTALIVPQKKQSKAAFNREVSSCPTLGPFILTFYKLTPLKGSCTQGHKM